MIFCWSSAASFARIFGPRPMGVQHRLIQLLQFGWDLMITLAYLTGDSR